MVPTSWTLMGQFLTCSKRQESNGKPPANASSGVATGSLYLRPGIEFAARQKSCEVCSKVSTTATYGPGVGICVVIWFCSTDSGYPSSCSKFPRLALVFLPFFFRHQHRLISPILQMPKEEFGFAGMRQEDHGSFHYCSGQKKTQREFELSPQ